MSTSATLSTTITLTGDVTGVLTIAAALNAASPGQIQLVTLASGANTITAPTGGSTPTMLTIIPPVGNTQAITIKGISTDTGFTCHLTNPSFISLAAGFTTFCLTTAGIITGMRLIWT